MLADAIARRWPTAWVTLLPVASASDDRLPALLAAGVEVVDVPDEEDWEVWIDRRRFHYSVVVRGGAERPGLDAALARTQPQSMVVLDLSRPDTQAEALRTADVVLCASEVDRLLVAAAAPDTPTFVVSHGPAPTDGARWSPDPLVEAMSHLGLAPPRATLERRAARA